MYQYFNKIRLILIVICFLVISNQVEAVSFETLPRNWTPGSFIPNYLSAHADHRTEIDDSSWIPDNAKIANIKVTQSGRWSQIFAGRVFSADDVILIPEGVEVVYDVSSSNPIRTIAVKGSFKIANNVSTKITVGTIHVYGAGEFSVTPASENIKSEIVFVGEINTTEDPGQMNLGLVVDGGKVTIVGAERQTSFTKVKVAKAGENNIIVENNIGWKVGDTLYLVGTQKDALPQYWNYQHQDQTEQVQITSLNDNRVSLNKVLTYDHDGYVANVSRNVVFRSALSSVRNRGHVMFTGHGHIVVRNASFVNLGRTTVAPREDTKFDHSGSALTVGGNQRARYTLHAHHLGHTFVFEGNSVITSPRYGIVIHDSIGRIAYNTVIGANGSGIFAEDGIEVGQIIGNLVVGTGGGTGQNDDARAGMLEGEDMGAGGFGYWFRGPLLEVKNNVATGYFNVSAFTYFTHPSFVSHIVPLVHGDTSGLGGKTIVNTNTVLQRYGSFENNVADGIFKSGLSIFYRSISDNSDLFKNFTVKNLGRDGSGIFISHSTALNFEQLNIRGGDRGAGGYGVYISNGTRSSVNIKNGVISNFTYGLEIPPQGGRLDNVVLNNIRNIKADNQSSNSSYILKGVSFF